MAIQFIDNQPVTFRTSWATDSECKSPYDTACTLYTNNDYLFVQWKQTFCGTGTNLVCDADFVNSNPELVSNGSFTSNSTGWTLGSGVTRDGTNQRIQFPGTTLTNALQQAITVANGTIYIVKFTIGGMTGGYITPKIDGTSGTPCFSAGTYSITITSAGTSGLYFDTHLFDGWIDDISVKKHVLQTIGGCWGGDANQWTINPDGSISKTGTSTAQLTGKINSFQFNEYYKMTFRITGMTAGTLGIQPNLVDNYTYSADGVYTVYFTGDTSFFTFTASADFNGTLSEIYVLMLGNSFAVVLKDTKNNVEEDLSDELEYFEDYITLKYQLGSVASGCYELCIYDACGYNVSLPLLVDPSFNSAGAWTLTPTGATDTITVTGGKMVYNTGSAGEGGYLALESTGPVNWTGKSVKVIDWTFTTSTVSYTGDCDISMVDNNGDSHNLFNGTLSANTTYSGNLTIYDSQNQAGSVGFSVSLSNIEANKVIELTEMVYTLLSYVPGQMAEYCSNCIEVIDYPDTDKCTQWVGGTNGSDAFGFHFNPNDAVPFQIGARVRSMMINPKYKGDLKKYTSASGYNTVTQGNSSKIYTLFIDYTDEHTHDWLRLATASDILRIGPFTNTTAKYVNTDGDYTPEWPDNLGNWPAAQARVEVQPLTDTLYNNNAG